MDYKSGYFLLFNKLTNIMLELEAIQIEAEETVICDDDPDIKIMIPDGEMNI